MMRLATLLATAACALATPAAAQTFAVTNATVATGDGGEPIEDDVRRLVAFVNGALTAGLKDS